MFNVKISSRIILTAAFCLVGAVLQTQAAVTVDQRSAGGAADNVGLPPLTWSHTVGSGANRALMVGVSTSTTTLPAFLPVNRVQGVTYGGTAMTRVGTVASGNGVNAAEIFVLVNPPNGTANVVATFSETIVGVPAPFVNQASGNSVSLFGVSQTTPTGAFVSGTGNNNTPTVSVAGSVVGDLVFDTLAISPTGGSASAGANQRVCTDDFNDPNFQEITCTRGRRFFNFSYDIGAASTEPGALPSVTMSWTTTGADNWALGAVTVRQSVSTAATVAVGGRILTGGKGVSRARVTMIDANGVSRSTMTNFFGYYRFAGVSAGETYRISVSSKQHSFAPRIITVNEETIDLNFTAQP